jgi:hypothetical protein
MSSSQSLHSLLVPFAGSGSALSHARRPRSTHAPDNDHYVSYDADVAVMVGHPHVLLSA